MAGFLLQNFLFCAIIILIAVNSILKLKHNRIKSS